MKSFSKVTSKPISNPKAVEFYLCVPPMMIKACIKMLAELGVGEDQSACDEFKP